MMWKLLEQDNLGYFNSLAEWLSKKEAEDLREHYAKTFPNLVFIIEQHDEGDKPYEEEIRNDNAIDGWEDLFP